MSLDIPGASGARNPHIVKAMLRFLRSGRIRPAVARRFLQCVLRRPSSWLASLLLIASLPSASHGQDSGNLLDMVSGTWVIKSIYPTPNVQGPDPSQQRRLVGTRIMLNTRTLKACGQSVPISSVKVIQVNADDFLANTLARFDQVGINAASVTEVVINNRQSGACLGAFPLPGQDIYVKSRDEVVFSFEGVFYQGVRKG